MNHLNQVFMVQLSTYNWRLENQFGKVIVDNVSFNNAHEAKRWAKNYASSFRDWIVEVKPLEKVRTQ